MPGCFKAREKQNIYVGTRLSKMGPAQPIVGGIIVGIDGNHVFD